MSLKHDLLAHTQIHLFLHILHLKSLLVRPGSVLQALEVRLLLCQLFVEVIHTVDPLMPHPHPECLLRLQHHQHLLIVATQEFPYRMSVSVLI
jgi:hypothetical protein